MPARRAVALCVAAGLIVPQLALVAPAESGSAPTRPRPSMHLARPIGGPDGSGISRTGAQLVRRGYLVPDPAGYSRAKAALAAPTGRSATPTRAATATTPRVARSFNGTFDPRVTPPDATGAAGPARYVELVNTKFAIYKRDGTKLSAGDLGVLTGMGAGFPYLTDPQIIWDPGTRRFYYVVLDFDVAGRSSSTNGVDFAFGFSKMASPSRARDWCKYTLSYGYDVPHSRRMLGDQPHLGDTADYLLWGMNVFDLSFGVRFRGADVAWVSKPPAGRRCPRPAAFSLGNTRHLRTAGGARAFTPVVANQVDGSHTGWIVAARHLAAASSRARTLSVFRVSPSPHGAVVQRRARAISVPHYGFPPPAPQAGTFRTLDTLDGRLTQAVAAVDPSRRRVVVWTQHAIRGRAGSIVRWYEIDPAHHRVVHEGDVSDPVLWAYNGAIAPDRVVRKGVHRFGRSMVLGFNTSSDSTDAAVQMVSKVPRHPQSAFVLVRRSHGPDVDFSCRDGTCRWGDYSGASPDPAAARTGTRGRVWLTNQWNVRNRSGVDWRTVNWRAAP